jgi:nicotinamidase/pyrazinamidase
MEPETYAVVDIDTQYDFVAPDGKLSVPGADALAPAFARLLEAARTARVPVLSSADNHPPGDPEFSEFPAHCLRGSPGQRKVPETLLANRTVIEPDAKIDDPSAVLAAHDQIIFHKVKIDVFSNPHFARFVEALGDRRFGVFGLTTEHCVRAVVEGLLDAGRAVAVVRDATRALSDEAYATCMSEFRARGARIVTTEEMVARFRPA